MKENWKSPGLGAALIVLLIVAAYLPALCGGFIWDDDDHLTANPAMTAPHGLQMIWSSLAVSRYYPLTLTSFWAQRQLWGLNPLPYHLVNILVHALNGVLIFLVLRRLRIPAAWLAGALWGLHPVNVESVAWITELKNTQSGFFFFFAVLCYLRFEAQEERRWYALALLCGACAFLSKASTVVLPLVLLLCAWWQRRCWRWTDFVRIAPFFVLALLMSGLTVVEQHRLVLRQGTAEWSLGIAQRMMLPGKAICFYLGKVVWPAKLAFVYPRWELAASATSLWLPLAGILIVAILLWTCRRQPWAQAGFFGFGFFVAALLPVLGFFNVFYFRYSFVADHFQYLASLGVIAYAASGIVYVLGTCQLWSAPVGNAMCAALLLTLGGLTWEQARIYRDSETLWRDTVAKNAGVWMAHSNLGIALAQDDKLPEAVEQFEEALQIDPNLFEVHGNLGHALILQGKVSEAINQWEQALRIKPDSAEVHCDLGMALEQAGKPALAIEQYELALKYKPNMVDARNQLMQLRASQQNSP
jgi:protein O-mannosyl-transferase